MPEFSLQKMRYFKHQRLEQISPSYTHCFIHICHIYGAGVCDY